MGSSAQKSAGEIRKRDNVSGTKKFQNVAQATTEELDTP